MSRFDNPARRCIGAECHRGRVGGSGQALIGWCRCLVLLSMMFVCSAVVASAQTDDNSHRALLELQQAGSLANSASEFFRLSNGAGSPSTADRQTAYFDKLHRAAAAFVRVAPQVIAGDALRSVQLMFSGRQGARPESLIEAVDECEKRNDPQLTRLVADTLTAIISAAVDDIRAEIKFGPIADNARFYGEVTPPKNPTDLLRNLAFALDHNAPIRRDFYAPENVIRFFGVRPTIYREENGGIWAHWIVQPADAEVRTLEPDVAQHAQCQYSLSLRVADTGKRRGNVGIACNFKSKVSFNFDQVQLAFGPDWQDISQAPRHGPPPPRIVANGNRRIAFDFDAGSLHRAVLVRFGPEALLGSFELDIEEH